MWRPQGALCLAAVALGLGPLGCSPSGVSPADGSAVDSGPCGAGLYPCGPYGTQVGAVVQDLTLAGYADGAHLCKAGPAMQMDLSSQRPLSFGAWYRGDASCPAAKPALLWVIVSAGWCPSCTSEAAAIQQAFAGGALDPRVALLEVVFETGNANEPATAAFVEAWIGRFGLTHPVAADPGFELGRFFSREATPFNMLVDLDRMTIAYRQTGGGLSALYQVIDAHFGR